jgi:hypothetical protein
MFDQTKKYEDKLVAVGFTPEQAEKIVEVIIDLTSEEDY